MAEHEHRLPRTVGLCPDHPCMVEFYMPEPKPGETCPMDHHDYENAPRLVVYVPEAEVERLRARAIDLKRALRWALVHIASDPPRAGEALVKWDDAQRIAWTDEPEGGSS